MVQVTQVTLSTSEITFERCFLQRYSEVLEQNCSSLPSPCFGMEDGGGRQTIHITQ